MLTVAKDKDGKVIQVGDAIRGKDYYCMRCGKVLRVRQYNNKKIFYHYSVSYESKGENESYKHLQAKKWLYEHLIGRGNEVILEKTLEGQRADVFMEPYYVYEIQYSPLSRAELERREDGYAKLHLKTVWLLGDYYFFSKKNKSYYPFLCYHPQLGFFYFEQHDQSIVLVFHITNDLNTVEKSSYFQLPIIYPTLQGKKINIYQRMRRNKRYIQKLRHQNMPSFRIIQTKWYLNHYINDEMDELLSIPLSLPFQSFIDELRWKTHYFFHDFKVSMYDPILSSESFHYQFNREYSEKIQAFYNRNLKEYEIW